MSDMTSIRSIKRSRSRRILVATSGFALIAALCYCLILGQGAVKLSPVEVIEVLTSPVGAHSKQSTWCGISACL